MTNSIPTLIRSLLLHDFLGKHNAKDRHELLNELHIRGVRIADRTMRRIYGEILPIGHCEDGIYVIDNLAEVDRMIGVKEKTVATLERKLAHLRLHRMYLVQREKERMAGQMRLF